MFRIKLPWTDGSLLLTPPLASLGRLTQAAILVVVLSLFLFLIGRLYRYERQFIPRFLSRLLLFLRLAVVSLVFVVACLKPTLRQTTLEEIPSHILIAIDLSDSMAVNDPQRDPIEKLELARALKLAPDLASDGSMAAWIQKLQRGESCADAAYARVLERVDTFSRQKIAEKVLAPEGLGLVQTLAALHQVELCRFDQRLVDLPPYFDSIRGIWNEKPKLGQERGTDLNLPLQRGLERRDEFREGLVGVVILSDGQHNWGGAPGELAHQLGHADGKAHVPVHTIVCGARTPPPDLVLASVKATPPIVLAKGSANIDVRLLVNNLPPCRIKVTIKYSDPPEGPERPPIIEWVDFDGVNQPPPRSVPVRMERAAAERLRVSVEANGADGARLEERSYENNSRDVTVQVAPDKARVLLIDGEARWEQYYLQTALRRDPTMETRSVIFDQPRLNLLKESDLASLKLAEQRWPTSAELSQQDCIILGDVSAQQLPKDEQARLEHFVADRGGTLVILAGKRSMPMEFNKSDEPLARLLPVTQPHTLEVKGGFQLTRTAAGLQTAFLRLENDVAASDERWSGLPPHFWAVVGKAKDGATTLAYVLPQELGDNANAERDNAILVRQNYGFGQVVFVGLDTTWRWRLKQGDKYHHRFWSQLIRWAASDRALIAGNEFMRFGVREPVYRGDQQVDLLARFGEKAKEIDRTALIAARLSRKAADRGPEEPIALVRLKPHAEVPGQFEAGQGQLPPGDYTMEIATPQLSDRLRGPDGKPLRAAFKVLPPETGEMLNLATNWERMKEIASQSGGTTLSADKAADLVELLKNRSATREIISDRALAQSWWMLIAILTLLSSEWVIRKWVGLL